MFLTNKFTLTTNPTIRSKLYYGEDDAGIWFSIHIRSDTDSPKMKENENL